MIRLKREDIIKRFSIGEDIYGKSLFKLDNKEYGMNGVLFIGNKAFYTNNTFMLFAKSLDMPNCEETQTNLMWRFGVSEEDNPIVNAEEIDKIEVSENPARDRLSSILSTRDYPLTEEDNAALESFWEKEVIRSFNTLTTNKVIIRKNDLLSELQKLYGKEKKSKATESVAIRIDRESGLLRLKPFRHKKKDLKREQKIIDTIPGGELLVPFFEDKFFPRYTTNDTIEKGIILRVQELELIKVFQENEYVSISANLIPFEPKERDLQKLIKSGMNRVFIKGYDGDDSTIRLQLPQVLPIYNPYE